MEEFDSIPIICLQGQALHSIGSTWQQPLCLKCTKHGMVQFVCKPVIDDTPSKKKKHKSFFLMTHILIQVNFDLPIDLMADIYFNNFVLSGLLDSVIITP